MNKVSELFKERNKSYKELKSKWNDIIHDLYEDIILWIKDAEDQKLLTHDIKRKIAKMEVNRFSIVSKSGDINFQPDGFPKYNVRVFGPKNGIDLFYKDNVWKMVDPLEYNEKELNEETFLELLEIVI